MSWKKTFNIYFYDGLLNRINTFINLDISYPFFYEFFFYRLDNELEDINKTIIIQSGASEKKEYKLTNYYSFSSKNRRRINIMNIPYQEDLVDEEDLINKSINSIQICELKKKIIQE